MLYRSQKPFLKTSIRQRQTRQGVAIMKVAAQALEHGKVEA
jgi:hypothetical protein